MLLCFIGTDGSGKTSHAKNLNRFLLDKGYSSKYVRAASRPILLYPFIAFARIFGFWKSVKRGAWTDPLEMAKPTVRKGLGRVYRLLLFVDFEITTFLKVRVQMMFTQVLICDRYIFDLLMELLLSDLDSANFTKMMLAANPTPKRTFFLNAPLQVVIRRRPEFSEENLRRKQEVYQEFARIFGFTVIDTSNPFEQNQEYLQKEALFLIKGSH